MSFGSQDRNTVEYIHISQLRGEYWVKIRIADSKRMYHSSPPREFQFPTYRVYACSRKVSKHMGKVISQSTLESGLLTVGPTWPLE